MNRIESICKSERGVASADVNRTFRELADELEGEEDGTVVEWDPLLKVPLMNNGNSARQGPLSTPAWRLDLLVPGQNIQQTYIWYVLPRLADCGGLAQVPGK